MNKKPHRTILISAVSLLAIFILGFTFPEQSKKDRAVWPVPPDEPKISYIMTIETPRNIGVKKSIFKKMIRFGVGRQTDHRIQRPFEIPPNGNGTVYVTDTGLQTIHV